jgi:small conductance mechanosensitive channel
MLWILGRYVAKWTVQLLTRSLTRHGFDSTLISYVRSTLTATLNVILVILMLGFFGIETTTFAALFAAVGVAIGMTWSGCSPNSRREFF